MPVSRFLILLLLSMLSILGCAPATPNDGVTITSVETTTNEVENPSDIKMPGSLSMWMIEGDRWLIPIDVQNISSMNMETVTATIVSDLPGFMIGMYAINFIPDQCATEGVATICRNPFNFMGWIGWEGTSGLGSIVGGVLSLVIYLWLILRPEPKSHS